MLPAFASVGFAAGGMAAIVALLNAAPPRRTAARPVPAVSYRSPFHAEQCTLAVDHARRAIAADPAALDGKRLLAEGLLCRGLQDDPWSLDAAIELFEEVVRKRTDDFWAQLGLADAVRKRFPLSARAERELRRARRLLARSDVGAARENLTRYVDENLTATNESRRHAKEMLAAAESAAAAGKLSVDDALAVANRLALTGSRGSARAREIVRELLAPRAPGLAAFCEAEIERGEQGPTEVRSLYVRAESELCMPRTDLPPRPECDVARFRLRQLERIGGDAVR